MPRTFLIFAAMVVLGVLPSAQAQTAQGDNTIPDAPQPQKKPVPKAAAPADSTTPNPPTPSEEATPTPPTKDDNAFPEDVSKAAAHAAENASGSAASQETQPATAKPATKNDNPFPEAVSREAAKAARDEQDPPSPPPTKPDLPPGVSSSQSSSSLDTVEAPVGNDPARAKKDEDVGSFYLKKRDYPGALLRYKDATASDPTDVEAIFGLAETQRMLNNHDEAVRGYAMYLAIVPDGPRAKQAMKALKLLQPGK